MSPLSESALKIAASLIGQKENPPGSNWGVPVQDYLARVGITFPASWCAAFVYWCFDEAAIAARVHNPVYRTAGVLNLWNHCQGNRTMIPGPGDIFIMDFGKGLGHTGIVESVDEKGLIHTIEGNSNMDGSRNGYEVVRHLRNSQGPKMKGFLSF